MKTKFNISELVNVDLLLPESRLIPVGTIDGTKRAVWNWIKFGGVIPTHMGELRKTETGYVYYTTIGRTFRFDRSSKGVSHGQ